ncbi:MAG: hypothetical protein LBT70_04055 [Holosporaceae bacterium]|jgi:hypothetical protein|nr:hypothetical protein [Holosporaceae bacterium]
MKKNLLLLLLLGGINIMLPSTVLGTEAQQEAQQLVNQYLTPLEVAPGDEASATMVTPKNIKPFFQALCGNNGLIPPVIEHINGREDKLTAAMNETYDANSLPEAIQKMILSADAVRQGRLYDQIAKFVGRVEKRFEDGITGTGTVVSWDGMPAALKGKVVITVLHNHPSASTEGVFDAPISKTPVDGVYLSNTKGEADPLEEHMWFTPDTDRNAFNVWKKGRPTAASIPVKEIYCFRVPEGMEDACAYYEKEKTTNKEVKLFDFAVLILKTPVPQDIATGVDITTPDDFSEGKECFLVGYGRPLNPILTDSNHPDGGSNDDKKKLFTGWNLKKQSLSSRTTGASDHYGDPPFTSPRNFDMMSVGSSPRNFDMMSVGPSYSGSSIVTDSGDGQYKIIGVFGGGHNTALTDVIDRIKGVLR